MKKKAEALRRSALRMRAQCISEKEFLNKQSYSRQVQSIEERHPDIGLVIEEFVQDCRGRCLQHAEDLAMLAEKKKLKPVFVNPETNFRKQITCV